MGIDRETALIAQESTSLINHIRIIEELITMGEIRKFGIPAAAAHDWL